jgi:hypothetical protein
VAQISNQGAAEIASGSAAGGFFGVKRLPQPVTIPVSAGNRQTSFRQSSAGSA